MMCIFAFLHNFSVHAACDHLIEISQGNAKVHPINTSLEQNHISNEQFFVDETNRLLKSRWFYRRLYRFSKAISNTFFCCSAGLYTLTFGSAGIYSDLTSTFLFVSNGCFAFNVVFFGISDISSSYLNKLEKQLHELAENNGFNLLKFNSDINETI